MKIHDLVDEYHIDRAKTLPAVLTYPGAEHTWSLTKDHRNWLKLFRSDEIHMSSDWTMLTPEELGRTDWTLEILQARDDAGQVDKRQLST